MLRHCAAIRATVEQTRVALELASAQLAGLEALARTKAERATAVIELPPTCQGYKVEDCARQSEEAVIELGGMGGSDTIVMCRGCGLNPHQSVVLTSQGEV